MNELSLAKKKYIDFEVACIREQMRHLGDVAVSNLAQAVYDNREYVPSMHKERAYAYEELCRLLRSSILWYPIDAQNCPITETEDDGNLKVLAVFSSKAEAELGDYIGVALNFATLDGLIYIMDRFGIELAIVDGDGCEPLRLYSETIAAIACQEYGYRFIYGV